MRAVFAVLTMLVLVPGAAAAQTTHWVVDTTLSLAWWQINPHMNHLWATTCPADPSWRPGEGRNSGWLDAGPLKLPNGYAAVVDTVVPLFPRKWPFPLCKSAVRGEVVTADTVDWRGTRGLITVRADSLETGYDRRDIYARRAVLETNKYPDLRFSIDSLADVRPGDTLSAVVVGVFELRDVKRAVTGPVRAWHEAGGLRVTARFDIDPNDMIVVYGMSRVSLGLGVGSKIWKTLHVGVDVVLKRKES